MKLIFRKPRQKKGYGGLQPANSQDIRFVSTNSQVELTCVIMPDEHSDKQLFISIRIIKIFNLHISIFSVLNAHVNL